MSEEKKKGLFARLREGLSKTRGNMTEKVDDMVREKRQIDEDFYEELEDILLMADCGLKATEEIVDELRNRVKAGKVKDAAEAREMLKQIMVEQMDIPRPPLKWPMVMLIVGVNGVGKTTTIGKLALRFQAIGRRVMLCAGDTFRAAAAEGCEDKYVRREEKRPFCPPAGRTEQDPGKHDRKSGRYGQGEPEDR